MTSAYIAPSSEAQQPPQPGMSYPQVHTTSNHDFFVDDYTNIDHSPTIPPLPPGATSFLLESPCQEEIDRGYYYPTGNGWHLSDIGCARYEDNLVIWVWED